MKKEKLNTFNIEPPDKVEYKTFYYYDYDEHHIKVFNELGKISKNIYNLTLYCIQIFNFYKTKLYEDLYNELAINNKIDCDQFIKDNLSKYFDLYSSLKDKLQENNNYVYKFIINYINNNNILIKNSNYEYYIDFFINNLKNDENIYLNAINDDLLFEDVIKRIINSIYIKNFNIVKDQLTGHKKLTITDQELIDNVKNNNFINIIPKNVYKIKIIEDYNITLKSDQNYTDRLAYFKLGYNDGKLDTTMIGSIMTKAHDAYTSYYGLLNKGIKANRPKFLEKNSKYNLIYTFSKALPINENLVKVYTSTYLANNFNTVFGDNYICLTKYKYIDKKYLKQIPNKKIKKKDNYIIDNLYIEKTNKNIFDSRHLKIKIPNKAKQLDIKRIEINFINNMTKVSLVYKTTNEKNKKAAIKSSESISIDLGMKNLLTIYNPTGEQKIIDGKFISSLNTYYNHKIAEAQSNKDSKLFNKYQMKRQFIINNYFNKIVKWMINEYADKKLIIIGYNKEWKQNINLGTANNMKFNKIPYSKLMKKIKFKFNELNKNVLLIEESYTSKCDSLALEDICKQDNYLGNRSKRGLFISSTNKLLNADINGAINIMRKIFKLNKIEGLRICNPIRVKIFREVQPADKSI